MAIITAMQSAAVRLVGQKPSVFFGADGNFEMEICDLVNEVATDIAKYQDWQALTKLGTVTGDGTTTEFAMPVDYDRMLTGGEMVDLDTWFWGFRSFADINLFLQAQASGFTGWPGGWVIYANKMRFAPAPESAQVATYPYSTTLWAIDVSTAPKAAFDSDEDTFLLPERLLTLGLVWRWRENKKLDATGDQEAFVKALDEYASKDGGSRVYRKRARRGFRGTQTGWPWPLGPATY